MKKTDKKTVELNKKKAYFIGIKGVGMTMLAQFLSTKNFEVSGSDIPETFLTDRVLKDSKIKVFSGFNSDNIPKELDLVVYSSAYNEKNNPELGYIKNNKKLFKNIELKSYAETLGSLFNTYKGIAVCGSHGKTSTSAWLGYLLSKSGKSPNVLVGSRVPQFKGSSLIGDSDLFVAEVDEYQNKLKFFNPEIVLLNNIDYDHPDFFKTEASYIKVFRDFVKKIPSNGFLVVNGDDKKALRVARSSQSKIISYGIKGGSALDYRAFDIKNIKLRQSFKVNNLGSFTISLLGKHNVYNALAVIATAKELKVPLKEIKKHLMSFRGSERRTQVLGSCNGVIYIDDYAHHPTEIKTTLEAIKTAYKNKRIVTVFHPHTFTRTKALFKDFSESFSFSDELIVLDIYGSAREKQGGVSSLALTREIKKFNKKSSNNNLKEQLVKNIKSIPEVAKYLKKETKEGDLVVLMGAGDVFRVAEIVFKEK